MSNYLPTDLVLEILGQLPVKSLVRFLTVSKSWRSIITTPTFISSHLSNAKNRTLVHEKELHSFLTIAENGPFETFNSSSKLEFPFKSDRTFRIVGSCDGFICLSDDEFRDSSQCSIIIWNPSVRNHRVLPNPTINPETPHFVVLGFGVASHAYKVVRLVYCMKPNDINFSFMQLVEIFSLETWSWRKWGEVDLTPPHVFPSTTCPSVFSNGVVHWLSEDDSFRRSSILAFDVGDEVLGDVMLPDELAACVYESVVMLRIFVIGESLGAVKYDRDNTSCDVWVMKEYCVRESWTKLYTIRLLNVVSRVIGFWKSGEALLFLDRQGIAPYTDCSVRFCLVVYNPDSRQTKDLGIYGSGCFYVNSYVESLLLLKIGGELIQ
ncbi:hypothetical protein ABFS83_13G027200 [Erythranthe nasuta]